MVLTILVVAAVAFFIIITFFKGVRAVPQGFEYTVEHFGKYAHTMSPGLHFLIADAFWVVEDPDLPAATPVRIVAVDGMTLKAQEA